MHKKRVMGAIAALLLVLSLTISADTGYNTKDDPLITLSYFNQFKKEVTDSMKTQVSSEVRTQIEAQVKSKIKSEITSQLTNDFKQSVSSEVRSQVMKDLKEELEQEIRDTMLPEMKKQVEEEIRAELLAEVEQGLSAIKTGYSIARLTAGQTLWAEDACEFFLVAGQAVCSISDPVAVENGMGLLDLTEGKHILNGEEVTAGHYLYAVFADGRGILVNSEEAYFMIRGEYRVE